MSDGQTQYGFKWGPCIVERLCHVEGRGYSISVRSEHGPEIQVYVSEKGRVVTAYPTKGGGVSQATSEVSSSDSSGSEPS